MSLKSLRLLNTFCWHSFGAWGDRMLLLIFCFSEFSTAENVWNTPIPFSLDAEVWAPASLFLFLLWFFLKQPAGKPQGPLPSPWPSQLTPMPIPTQSPQQNVMLSAFLGFVLFSPFVLRFSFPTKIMPRKQVVHAPCCFSTPSYVSPHPSVFYSLCKNWLI